MTVRNEVVSHTGLLVHFELHRPFQQRPVLTANYLRKKALHPCATVSSPALHLSPPQPDMAWGAAEAGDVRRYSS